MRDPVCLPAEVRPVPGAPGYAVSADGVVINRRGHVIRHMVHEASGHHSVLLSVGGEPKRLMLHRLVLSAWVGPCPPGHQCRHLDGNPDNNAVTNLRWGTPKENADDKRRHGTEPLGELRPNAKLTAEQASEIRLLFGSVAPPVLARRFGVSRATVHQIGKGLRWRHVS